MSILALLRSPRALVAPGLVTLALHGCASTKPAEQPDTPPAEVKPSRPIQRPGQGPRSAAGKELDAAIKAANAGDLDGAITSANAAIAKDPNLEKAYLLLGSACSMKDDLTCEKDAYDRGTTALPMSAALLAERGLLLLRTGDAKGAVADLERANELTKSNDPKIMADLAFAYAFVDRLDDGASLAAKARKLDPKSFDAASAHGEVLLRKRDGKGAEEAFRAALALTEDAEVKRQLNRQLALALALDGRYADALAIHDQLIAADAEDPVLRALAAEALLKLDRPKDAQKHMEVAVKLAPKDARFWSLLLETQQRAGDKKGAELTKKKLADLGVK
ncbi:tetratricopeptide repeat protein [Myxococcota bacterium]|nr:tetratricopeptide repeat protein [Myxococcota bacterium]